MKELKQIIAAYHKACKEGIPTVLATVVHIEGSSYRGPGARMLVSQDGSLVGAISGGCLEGDALRKALMVMVQKKPLLLTYDTSADNDVLGVGLGCNGIIRVLLEPLGQAERDSPICLFEEIIEERIPATLVTYYLPDDPRSTVQGTKYGLSQSGKWYGSASTFLPKESLKKELEKALEHQASTFVAWKSKKGMQEAPEIHAFLEFIAPTIRLIIAGAGNDVLPLVEMAKILGWEIVLMDGRPSYAKSERFPNCQIYLGDGEELTSKQQVDEWTAILLMSHNYAYDKAVLKAVVHRPVRYIGILGPKKKTLSLLMDLEEEGEQVGEELRQKIHGPVGLDIGAESSEEIALSIISGVKSFFAGRPGGELRAIKGSIHHRQTKLKTLYEHIGIIILAAGSSKRMGKDKQTMAIDGVSLLRSAALEALDTGAKYIAAVIADDASEEIVHELAGLPLDVVPNSYHREGMAASIRVGLSHLLKKCDGLAQVMILVCDQVFVDSAHLNDLIGQQKATGASIVASSYQGVRGVPAIFDHTWFDALLTLRGDTGAKQLIRQFAGVHEVAFPQGGKDVDTPEDYRSYLK